VLEVYVLLSAILVCNETDGDEDVVYSDDDNDDVGSNSDAAVVH